ncbi:hypothetical protein CEP51_008227 [Fusarium floridanum]|uniref:Zn(2)-C6 fungal-type domain-containing protein n=1 Tax=Fusarium floridanum TaxID=1325733 RepID=A0A428RLL3_9HYPO|nr:hypothetical protein CEP51_008227 [Fusarium floridanum]
MRSFSGCQTCRRRKLKCDEVKPVCGPCRRGSRECCYSQRSIFRHFETSPRERSFSRHQEQHVFQDDHVWLHVPAELRFIHVKDPYAHQDEPTQHLGELPDAEQESVPILDFPGAIPDSPVEESVLTPTDEPQDYTEHPQTPSIDEPVSTSNLTALHLLRHFKQGPGQWMDIFDTGSYFSCKVPVIAATKPLLKSAVCAVSAKHLDRLSRAETSPENGFYASRYAVDWHYQSAKHYGEAINHLKNAVDLRAYENDLSDKEDMLAAVAILCIYELMDAPDTAWRAHLKALPLFDPKSDPFAAPSSPVVIPRTAIQGPIFWSLARQDLLCAFISETQTRLDLKDMRLWQNAGLATNENGSLMPFSPPGSADVRTSADIEEDTKSNELTWLLGKISNYLTSGDAINPTDYALPHGQRPPVGVTQERLLERWKLLMAELQKWYNSLPSTFQPSARTVYSGNEATCFTNFEQIWYELPICAATMQNYHMAMILLLVNRPQESTAIRSTVSARLNSYRQIQAKVHDHAREICGISLANPTDPMRINSVQALFVAGQVFFEGCEQEAVLRLLEGIQRDLGWTTSFHTAKLVDEWPKG